MTPTVKYPHASTFHILYPPDNAMPDVHERLSAVERKAEELAQRMDTFADALSKNTKTTNAIKEDTGQMVALFKASLLGAGIIKWLAVVGGGLIVAYAALKGLAAH